jgi:hypothetical protein
MVHLRKRISLSLSLSLSVSLSLSSLSLALPPFSLCFSSLSLSTLLSLLFFSLSSSLSRSRHCPIGHYTAVPGHNPDCHRPIPMLRAATYARITMSSTSGPPLLLRHRQNVDRITPGEAVRQQGMDRGDVGTAFLKAEYSSRSLSHSFTLSSLTLSLLSLLSLSSLSLFFSLSLSLVPLAKHTIVCQQASQSQSRAPSRSPSHVSKASICNMWRVFENSS